MWRVPRVFVGRNRQKHQNWGISQNRPFLAFSPFWPFLAFFPYMPKMSFFPDLPIFPISSLSCFPHFPDFSTFLDFLIFGDFPRNRRNSEISHFYDFLYSGDFDDFWNMVIFLEFGVFGENAESTVFPVLL